MALRARETFRRRRSKFFSPIVENRPLIHRIIRIGRRTDRVQLTAAAQLEVPI
jgi:hypothetical protein